jgi:hypothetical protein
MGQDSFYHKDRPIYPYTVVAISLNLLLKKTEALQTHPDSSNGYIRSVMYCTWTEVQAISELPTYLNTTGHSMTAHRLCYRPAVFFRHHRLTTLSLPQRKIRRTFQKCYFTASAKVLKEICVLLEFYALWTGSLSCTNYQFVVYKLPTYAA